MSERHDERERQTGARENSSAGNTYPGFTWNCRLVQLLPAQCSALIQSDAKLVACQARSIYIQASGIIDVTGRVYDALECAIEHNDGPDEIVGALGRNICAIRYFD